MSVVVFLHTDLTLSLCGFAPVMQYLQQKTKKQKKKRKEKDTNRIFSEMYSLSGTLKLEAAASVPWNPAHNAEKLTHTQTSQVIQVDDHPSDRNNKQNQNLPSK